jgi:hypothetical protein
MSGYLSVLVPITITSAVLLSTTAVGEGYLAWDKTKTYGLGDYCYSAATQRNYRSLAASNLNKDPTDVTNRTASGTATTWWLDVGPPNQLAMFDKKIGTKTKTSGDLTLVLRPGPVSSLYVAGVSAGVLNVTVRDATGGEVVFTYSGSMEGSAPDDYWEYFFDPFEPLTDMLVTGIPPYGTGEVTVSLTNGGGGVECGALAVGDVKVLGQTLADAEAEPVSYAYIDTDQWGNTDIVDGPSATNLTMSAVTETRADGARAQAIVTSLLGKQAFWFCSDRPDAVGLRTWGLGTGKFSYDGTRCHISMTVKGGI